MWVCGLDWAVGGRLVHRLKEDSVHGTATYRCDDTRCCIIQY